MKMAGSGEGGSPVIGGDVFGAVDMRAGVVVDVQPFPEARKPAYKIWVDFGPAIGIRQTSAQVTAGYTPDSLKGKTVVGWVNGPERQIGPFMSSFLLLGVPDVEGSVRLLSVDGMVEKGVRVF